MISRDLYRYDEPLEAAFRINFHPRTIARNIGRIGSRKLGVPSLLIPRHSLFLAQPARVARSSRPESVTLTELRRGPGSVVAV